MKLIKSIIAMAAAVVASVGYAGDSAPFRLDTMEGTRTARETEMLTYSSLWDGDMDASVTIAQDDATLVENLVGEGEYAWSVQKAGAYVLTHTTYTNGVAGKVETATFVVIKNVATMTVGDIDAVVYTGSALAPEPTVIDSESGYTLVKDIDYTLSYANNTAVGTATVTITGKGCYTGSVVKNFTVAPKMLTAAMVGGVANVTYAGSAHKPEPTVTDVVRGATLVKGTDYTLSWGANTAAGSGSVTVTGKGNYTGTVMRNFTIAKAEVTPPASVASKAYTGALLTADVSATSRYTVQNNGGVNVGSYPVVLTLTDSTNYRWKDGDSNPLALTFTITKAANSWTTQPSIAGWTYGQAANAPNLGAAKFGNVQVSYSATPQNAGSYTATFTVPETANYSALSKSVPFAIARATYDMSNARWSEGSFTYDGTQKSVIVEGLPSGVTVQSYANNAKTAAGNYTATVALNYDTTNFNTPSMGSYNWSIARKSIADATVTLGPTLVFNGTEQSQAVTGVKVDGLNATYTISGNKGTGAGSYTLTVTGTGNFAGTSTAEFQISPKMLADAMVTVADTAYTYDGAAKTPTVSVTDGDPSILTASDYDVVYSDNVNAGTDTAKVTVTGKRNYTGAVTKRFSIVKATYDMSGAKWDYTGEFKYDGGHKTVLVTGLPTGVTVSAYSGNTGSAPGTYTAHAELLYDTTNYNKPEIADLVWGIKSAEETTLKEVFDGLPATIEPDGNGGWTVTITNDIDSADLPIEIPDNLGQVTIDLGGHDIVGENGADGDGTTPGGNGMPAIVIVAGDGDGEPTVLTIVTSGGDASVKGGDGGAGNPGGDGAPAVEVEDGARDGVVVNIGAGVVVQGGDGGASDTGRGGDGGAGIVGNVGTNDGTIVGGDGGDSGSGDGGNGGSGVDGNVGTNNGDISGGDGGASEGGDSGDSGEGVTGEVGENNGDVLPYALTDAMVGVVANQPFTGGEVRPAPIVYDGVHDKVLEEGVDYVLAWKDNVWPGTATIIVTGKGNYRGEVSRDFAIVSPVELSINAGEYFKATLAELGYDVPTNGVTPYSVVAKGLPAGLKLKYNAAVTKKVKKGKTTKKVVVKPAKVEWWIEGVPTAAMDFFTNPPYLMITVGGVAGVHALPIEVLAQNVTELEDLALGQTLNEQFYLPGVTNGWTVSGLPTGLKYTAKVLTEKWKSGKKTMVVTNALPYSVYGKTTKAGLFTITAKKKVGAYYETMKYRVLVRPKAVDAMVFGEELTNITTMAYVPVKWDLTNDVAAVGGKVAKVTGLPTGLSFAAKDTYAYKNAKKKTGKYLKQYGQTIVGTPTKPGTYVVTFTKNVTTGTGKNKKTVAKTAQILWTVTANDAELELGFNTAGGVIEGGTVGLKYGDLMAFTATDGATVTASGMPAGITLANLGGGSYAFRGFTTKAGTYLVTVKATLKGKTVTQRVALKVDALPAWAKGTFNGAVTAPRRDEGIAPYQGDTTNGLATITVSSVGKISGKFYEGGTNWTFTAASYTGYDNAAPAYSVPVVTKYSYKEKVKVKVKGKWTTKTVTKSVARNFTLRVGQDALGGVATLEEVGGGSTVHAWQNLWGSTYKAIGKKLFYTSAKKPYRVFTINAASDVGAEMGLTDAMSLSLKVTTAGAVTATMSFDTGKTSKGKPVIYKTTCSTVVIPLSAADNEEFEGEAILFFAPSPANGFPGFAGAAPL